MKMEVLTLPRPSICVGCLSEDRNVTSVDKTDCRNVFYEILGSLEEEMLPPLLCWECYGIVKKINKFKIQVKIAQLQLVNYSQENNKLRCMSSLRTHITPSCVECVHADVDIKAEVEEDGHNNESMFVSDYYIEEHHTDCQITKQDSMQAEVPADNSNSESSCTNTKAVEVDEFDESDEEPLTVKKQKRIEVKKEKVRKKRKLQDGSKQSVDKQDGLPKVIDNARVTKRLNALNIPVGQIDKVKLAWEQVEEEREKALKSVVFTRHEYRCYDCVLGFNHKFKLDNHMKKHDQSAGECVCEVCRVRCRDNHALYAHRRRHQVRWRCLLCLSLWSSADVAADHYSRAHGAPAPRHTCHVCTYTTTTLGKLRNHIKNHAERQRCEHCGKTFRDRTSLKTHLFIHKREKEYSCEKCDKKFHFKKAMEVHLVTHQSSAHMYCYQCDMNFKNSMSFYQHMKYNLKHIDPAKLKHVCGVCDKRFAKLSRLREHEAALHLRTTPLPCTHNNCDFAASSRAALRAHVVSRHARRRTRRDHVCHTCGKAYTSKKSLEGHLRSHTGERPFACACCGARFGYHAALYNHNKLVHRHLATKSRPAPPAPAQIPSEQTSEWDNDPSRTDKCLEEPNAPEDETAFKLTPTSQ